MIAVHISAIKARYGASGWACHFRCPPSWGDRSGYMIVTVPVYGLWTISTTMILLVHDRCCDDVDHVSSRLSSDRCIKHDDVIKWKNFPRYWPFAQGIHRSPVNSPRKGHAVTRSFDVFFDLRQNKQLSKQLWGWWFETPSHSLWRQCNDKALEKIKHNHFKAM